MSRLKITWIVLIAAALLAASWLIVRPRNQQANELNLEILERSHAYIKTLNAKPLGELTTEEKLLLLHSYFNVNAYHSALAVGRLLQPEIEKLPPERRKAFEDMLAVSRRRAAWKP